MDTDNKDADEKWHESCPECPSCFADCPAGFEKIVDLKNGLILYRRLAKPKKACRDKREINDGALKSVIIQNTSETEVTSAEILQEMQKKDITCPRCRKIVELALKLLQKVPSLNKKTVIGICDHCKLKDPCFECKEIAKYFSDKCEENKSKELATESKQLEKWIKAASFLSEKVIKKPPMTGSELRIKEQFHREYSDTKREVQISELCSQLQRAAKSLPIIIKKKKKYLKSDETFLKKPSKDSKISVQKLNDMSLGKSISPSTTRDKKTTEGFGSTSQLPGTKRDKQIHKYVTGLYSNRESLATVDEATTKKSRPIRDTEKQKHDQKAVDDHYLSTIENKDERMKKTSHDKPSATSMKSVKQTTFGRSPERKKKDKHSKKNMPILKKGTRSPRLKSKTKPETTEKVFDFNFPAAKIEKDLVTQKTSVELINNMQDFFNEENKLKIKIIKKRIKKEEELENKLIEGEKKAKSIAEKSAAEKVTNSSTKQKTEQEIKPDKIEETNEKLTPNKQFEIRVVEKGKKSAKTGKRMAETQLKEEDQLGSTPETKNLTDTTRTTTPRTDREKIIPQLESNETESGKIETQQEFEKQKELANVKAKEMQQKQKDTKEKVEKNKVVSIVEKGKGKELLKEKNMKEKTELKSKEKSLLKKEKEDKKEEKDFWKIQKKPEKQDKSDTIIFKVGTKGTQTPNEKRTYGLADALKDKRTKRDGEPQLARLRNDAVKKTAFPLPADKKIRQKTDKRNMEMDLRKIKARASTIEEVVVNFKNGTIGPKYRYKGQTLREHWDIHEKCHQVLKEPLCPYCICSDLELNVALRFENLGPIECIKGQKIVKVNQLDDINEKKTEPLLFATRYKVPPYFEPEDDENKLLEKQKNSEKPKTVSQGQTTDGVMHYVLSDRRFIEKGWTVLPTEKVMRKMNVYRMRPSKPEFDWFQRNREKQQMFYDSGERFAELADDGSCHWYYKNQRRALDYYDAEECLIIIHESLTEAWLELTSMNWPLKK